MKETFEKRLRDYGEVAKDQIKNDLELNKELETVRNWQVKKASDSSGTGVRPQIDIYGLQLEKQVIIDKLKKDIIDLDKKEGKNKKEGEMPVSFADGKTFLENGEIVTIGELITDGEWNIDYGLNPELVPRQIRKRYLVERAKIKLQRSLDDQIAINEKESVFIDKMKRMAYRKSLEEKETEKAGLLAEKMIRNLLRKISIDLGGDFEISKADLYQDVNQKIDFIIKRNVKERGVKVEESKENNTGIQFTINTNEEVIKHKTKQVERSKKELRPEDHIQDIVLISIPIKDINIIYTEWKKDKKSGGPDKLWPADTKRRIFSEIMKGFLTEEEIREQIEKIK